MTEERHCDNCAYHSYSEEYCQTERKCKRAFGDNWEDGRRSVKVEAKEEDLFGCDTCKHEDVDIDAPPCCDCWVSGCDQWENWEPKEKEQDVINHPEHYTFGKHECIEEMQRMFGKETVLHWCMCNVYKYRYRATHKNGEEDLKKADWYIDKIIELQDGSDSFGR